MLRYPVQDDQPGLLLAGGLHDGSLSFVGAPRQQVGQAQILDERADVPGHEEAEAPAVRQELGVGLRIAGEVEAGGALAGRMEGHLLGERRLARAWGADHHGDGAAWQTASEDAVQVGNPRVEEIQSRPVRQLVVFHVGEVAPRHGAIPNRNFAARNSYRDPEGSSASRLRS
jgi:hypothetical protein